MTSVINAVTEDTLALYGHLTIVSVGETRLKFYQAFSDLYERSGFSHLTYGQLANYSEMAEFVTTLTVAKERYDNNFIKDFSKVPEPNPLYTWGMDDWKSFENQLKTLRDRLLRYDANATVKELEEKGEDSQQNYTQAESDSFSTAYFQLMKHFTLHKDLAPFRKTLEEKLEVSEAEGQFDEMFISDDFLAEFRDAVSAQKDHRVQKAMRRLLNAEQTSFRSNIDIYRLFNDPDGIFSYAKLIQRTDKIIQAWSEAVLKIPRLAHLYEPGRDSATRRKPLEQEEMRRLQKSRARLTQHMDPLPQAIAVAAKARRRPVTTIVFDDSNSDDQGSCNDDRSLFEDQKSNHRKKRYLGQQPSAKLPTFNDEDNEEEDDVDDLPPDEKLEFVLRSPSKMPEAASSPGRKKRKSQSKNYEGRRPWSDAETEAIKQGMTEYGWGKWAIIKEHYHAILKDRTSGQIKDKARNMKNKGELDYFPEENPETSEHSSH